MIKANNTLLEPKMDYWLKKPNVLYANPENYQIW